MEPCGKCELMAIYSGIHKDGVPRLLKLQLIRNHAGFVGPKRCADWLSVLGHLDL